MSDRLGFACDISNEDERDRSMRDCYDLLIAVSLGVQGLARQLRALRLFLDGKSATFTSSTRDTSNHISPSITYKGNHTVGLNGVDGSFSAR